MNKEQDFIPISEELYSKVITHPDGSETISYFYSDGREVVIGFDIASGEDYTIQGRRIIK